MRRFDFLSINKIISYTREFNIFYLAVVYIGMGITSCQNVDNYSNYQIFNYNEDAGITTLDPALARSQSEIWVVSQLFNSLIDLDKDLKPVPGLAQKWSVENGGKHIQLTLKKNIRFCSLSANTLSKSISNKTLSAYDVVASLQRVSNPVNASPGLWIFTNVDTTQQGRGIWADNDSTVSIYLSKPQASFISLLATSYCSVLPKELCVQEKSFISRNPIGTGPFYLKRWETDVKLVLRKNPSYFEKDSQGVSLPYLDAIAVSFIKNKQTAFMQFVAGKFDFFNGLEGSFKDELLTDSATLKPKYKSRFNLLVTPFLNTEYIGLNMDSLNPGHPILRNQQFRKAMSLAIPRDNLVRFVRNGLGDPANEGFIPPVLLPIGRNNSSAELTSSTDRVHPNKLGIAQSNNRSQEISTKASVGVSNVGSWELDFIESKRIIHQLKSQGIVLPELVLTTNADYLDMAVYLQKAWKDVGISVTIDLQPSAVLRKKRNEGSLQLFRGSWIADYPDAESYLACFYGPYCSPDGPNYTHFISKEYDQLYRDIESGMKGQEYRNEAIKKALSILNENNPVIPLYYDKSLRLFHPWVTGLQNDAANRLLLKRVKVKHSLQ